jgi:hypothetical protein
MREQQYLPNISVEDCNLFIQATPHNSSIYEFGTYTGSSAKIFMDMAAKYNPGIMTLVSFDSFNGLPEEDKKIQWVNPDWPVGEFDSREHFKVSSVDEVIEKLKEKWKDCNIPVEFVPGFYDKTLTDDLARRIKYDGPSYLAGFIHIDCDIYSSTITVLDWLFRNDLVVPNAIFRFDDLLDPPMWEAGESLALKEVIEKYNLKFDRFGLNVFVYRGRE